MSVLLKGMNMPRDGERLKVWIEANGQVIVDKRTYYEEYEAVDLPDHGDLIDKDELMKRKQCVYKFGEYKLYAVDADTILNMPVVIPSERSEE